MHIILIQIKRSNRDVVYFNLSRKPANSSLLVRFVLIIFYCFNIDLLRLVLLSDQRNIQFGNETHSPKVVTLFTTEEKRGSKSGRSNYNLSYFKIGPNSQPSRKVKHFILEKSVFSVAHCMQHPTIFRNQPIISCF
jgi:hypothetical protein